MRVSSGGVSLIPDERFFSCCSRYRFKPEQALGKWRDKKSIIGFQELEFNQSEKKMVKEVLEWIIC